MNNQAVKEDHVVDIVEEDSIPDSFIQGLNECEGNQTVDIDIALNSSPPGS